MGAKRNREEGTACMVDKKLRKIITEFANGRISYIKIKSNISNILMINVCALAQRKKESKFYNSMRNKSS